MHLFSSDDIIRHILSSLIPYLSLLSLSSSLILIFLSYPYLSLLSSTSLSYPLFPFLSPVVLLSPIFLFYPSSSSFYPPSSSPSLDDMSQGRREAFDVFRSEYPHNAVIEENKKTLKQR